MSNRIHHLESSHLKNYSYDSEKQELIIEFKSGEKYKYPEVPFHMVEGLRNSVSPGKYLDQHLKKFEGERIHEKKKR